MLTLYRRAIWLRKRTAALYSGALSAVSAKDGVFSFLRTAEDGDRVVVVLNTTTEPRPMPDGQVLLSTHDSAVGSIPPLGAVWVRPL